MTRAAWAERKARKAAHSIQPVDFGSCEGIRVFAKTLEDEHRRAVRVVKAEYDRSWKKEYVNEAYREGRLNALAEVLAALQKGRAHE